MSNIPAYQQTIAQLWNNPQTSEIVDGLTWFFGDDAIEEIGSWLYSDNENLNGQKPVNLIVSGQYHHVMTEINMMIIHEFFQQS